MKKSKILTMVTLSTLVLAQAGTAFADEVATDNSVNDVVLLSGDKVDDTIGDVVTPPSTDGNTGNETKPSVPKPPTTDEVGGTVKPDVPNNPDAGGDTTKPSKPSQPSNPDVPNKPDTGGDTTKPSNPSQPTNPDVPNNPDTGGDTTKPSEPSQPSNPPITDDAVNKDDQGNITIKPQPVAPNQTVVGTQNGQLLIQDISGNTRLAEATEFGGQKNDNGTVSFKTADGKTVTLPETGESMLGVIIGLLIILAGLGLGFKDKLKALVDNIKAKSKK